MRLFNGNTTADGAGHLGEGVARRMGNTAVCGVCEGRHESRPEYTVEEEIGRSPLISLRVLCDGGDTPPTIQKIQVRRRDQAHASIMKALQIDPSKWIIYRTYFEGGTPLPGSAIWERYPEPEDVPVVHVVLGSTVMKGHIDYVWSISVFPDGRIVSGAADTTISVWSNMMSDAKNPRSREVMIGHTEPVRAVACLSDGRIISGSLSGTIIIWSKDGVAEQHLKAHEGPVDALAIFPDGRIVSGSKDTNVLVWSLEGELLNKLVGHHDRINAIITLRDRNELVSGSGDHTLRIWEANGETQTVLQGHKGPVYAVIQLLDGRIASGSSDTSIIIWHKIKIVPQTLLTQHTGPVTALALLPGGELVSGSHDKTVIVWGVGMGTDFRINQIFKDSSHGVTCLGVHSDGWIVSSEDEELRLWSHERLTGRLPYPRGAQTADDGKQWQGEGSPTD